MVGEELSIRRRALERLQIGEVNLGACYGEWVESPAGGLLVSYDPSEGTPIGKVLMAAEEDYDEVVYNTQRVFERWRMHPAPKRGEIVREIGEELRKYKNELGALVSIEMGKILQEGL